MTIVEEKITEILQAATRFLTIDEITNKGGWPP